MRLVCLLAVLAAAMPALATTWDFNDGTTQGWSVAGNVGAGAGLNPVGVIAEPADNTGALYLPDSGYATMSVPSTNSFVYSAEICGARMDVNRFFRAGMAYRHTYNKDTTDANTLAPPTAITAWFEGRSATSERMLFRDTYAGTNTDTGMTWLKAEAPAQSGDYNIVETARATIYYNYEDGAGPGEAGKIVITWQPLDYAARATNAASPFVYSLPAHLSTATGAVEEVNLIRLGGDISWSQFYADNVSFIPEPATLALLGLGALPLFRRRR